MGGWTYPAVDLIGSRSGATAIEYALIAAVISVAIVAAVPLFQGKLLTIFDNVVSGFEQAVVDDGTVDESGS